MIAEIIGVGVTFENGDALEQATALIARELSTCGVHTQGCCAVGTDAQALRTAIAQALSRSDVVILAGGLGAGADGISKEVVCEGLGRRLVLHEDSLLRIKEAYRRAGRQMPQQITRLAMLPEQSIVFPGSRGITPGCALSAGNQFILIVPEKAAEFVPMFRASVLPYLAKFSDAAVVARAVNVFGCTEAEAAATLDVLLKSENPVVEVLPKQGELQIRVSAQAGSKAEAAALCAPMVQNVRAALGDLAYGVDEEGLPALVVNRLHENRLTISVGEAGTDGLLTELLTAVAGAEQVLLRGVSANSARIKQDALKVPEKLLKKHGAVSAQIAAAMACGAMLSGSSAAGIGVAASSKGDDSKKAGTFYVAVCNRERVWVKKATVPRGAAPDYCKYIICMTALDLLRLYTASPNYPGGTPLKVAMAGKISNVMEAGNPVATTKKRAHGKKRPWYGAILPIKGDTGGEVLRKLILILAVLVFLGSGAYLLSFYTSSASNKKLNEGLENAYSTELSDSEVKKLQESGGYPKDYQKKFASLYQINKDVAGWVKVKDTQINYPVVQYIDNDYYLRRDFQRKDNKHGIPWLDFKDAMNPQSDGYVIYGHNMTDGQMFGELMKYKPSGGGISFLQQHPIVSFDDVYRDNDYKIMSVFITNVKKEYGEIFYYNSYSHIDNEAQFNEYVKEIRDRSYYDSNVDAKFGDKFLTLSTCSYEFGPVSDDAHVRTVIVARRVRDGEKNDGSDITYSMNADHKLPTGFINNKSNAQIAADEKAAASAAASITASNAAQSASAAQSAAAAQSSSKTSSLSESDEELLYRIENAQITAENARADAEAALRTAKKAADNAVGATRAADARAAANQALSAMNAANTAYEHAKEARYTLQDLDDEFATAETKAAHRAAVKAEDAAKAAAERASEYYNEAEHAAATLEGGRPSSSSSSSTPTEPSTPTKPSSTPTEPSTPAKPSTPTEPSTPAKPSTPTEPSSTPTEPSTPTSTSSASEPTSTSSASEPTSTSSASEGGGTPTAANGGWSAMQLRTRQEAAAAERLAVISGGKKVSGEPEKIVAAVVMNEMGVTFEPEALKAQAVAVYTYIKYQNKSGSTPYLTLKEPSREIAKLTREVLGEAVYYKNKLAFTPFYSASAGVTNASADVWGGAYPYLVSVDSAIDEEGKNYEMTLTLSANAVAEKVRTSLGIDLYDYSDNPHDWFEILSYTEGGRYVKELRVGDETTTGRILREKVLGLRSAAFDINYKSGKFVFTTYGYGHGVGMSQIGANLYAQEGWTYDEILEHYYPGTQVK